MLNAKSKIEVIRTRINEEKIKLEQMRFLKMILFQTWWTTMKPIVDRSFAEQTYLLAREAYDTALFRNDRQSRYLAVYIEPTIAQESEYPYRYTIIALTITMSCLFWSIFWLIYYSVRDRK